jgi:glycosyltransferase involved in cell wall biosynthesis
VSDSPAVSIVIPAYNAEKTIGATLAAIAAQGSDTDFEVIVADNGSTDGTRGIVESWRHRLRVRVVDASARRRQAAARNIAAREACGDLLVFTDADDAIMPGWFDAWRRLDPAVEFASGPVVWFAEGQEPPSRVPSVASSLSTHMGFRPYALGTNFAVRRRVFEACGGFDESMPSAEDVELSWRLQTRGVELVFVPEAMLAKRDRGGVRATIAQYYAYGLRDPVLYRRYRAAGVPRPRAAPTLRSYLGLLVRLPLLLNRAQRVRWAHQVGRRVGRLVGSVRARTFYP